MRSAHPALLAVSIAEEMAAAWSRSFWVSRRRLESIVSSTVDLCPDAGVTCNMGWGGVEVGLWWEGVGLWWDGVGLWSWTHYCTHYCTDSGR